MLIAIGGDDTALSHQPLHHRHLVFGEHFGHNLVDAELRSYSVGGARVVAGEQNDADAHLAERIQGGGRGVFDGIGDFEKSREMAINGHAERGGMGFGEVLGGDVDSIA